MIFEISEKANEDLEKIWLYTYENWSQKQADRYYNLILNEIEYIATNFESGKPIETIRKGYRCSKVKSHLIFYRKSKKEILWKSSEFFIKEWILKTVWRNNIKTKFCR